MVFILTNETGINEIITQVKTNCKVLQREVEASGLQKCGRRSCGVREGFPEKVTLKWASMYTVNAKGLGEGEEIEHTQP